LTAVRGSQREWEREKQHKEEEGRGTKKRKNAGDSVRETTRRTSVQNWEKRRDLLWLACGSKEGKEEEKHEGKTNWTPVGELPIDLGKKT